MPTVYSREAAAAGDNAGTAMKSVVVDNASYDWQGDQPLRRPIPQTVIYEMHVAGFTATQLRRGAGENRGTYAGLIEKIPYLQQLGVKTVELMPVQQFDPHDAPGGVNYWGYQPSRLVRARTPPTVHDRNRSAPVDEFRDLVKALHRADIEVILDVVFNHTAEGDERGPTLSCAASITKLATSMTRKICRATSTTPAAAIPSTATTPSCDG